MLDVREVLAGRAGVASYWERPTPAASTRADR